MLANKPSRPQNNIGSLIGAGTKVSGVIFFSGGLHVDGEVDGNIIANLGKHSTLVLGEHARVNGEINVKHLVINGVTTGPVYATEHLELQSKAMLAGDVHYRTVEIQLGAIIEGKLIHLAEASDKLETLKPIDAKS